MGESLTALYLQNPQLAALLRRQAFSQQLGKEATSFEPIQSPWQGVAKLANAGLAAMLMNKEDEGINSFLDDQKKQESDWNAQVQAVRNPGGQPQAPQQVPPIAAALMGKPPAPSVPQGGNPYADLIQTSAANAGIPPAMLTAMVQKESNFDPNARNPKSSASGLGGILASSAAQPGYGMQPLAPEDRMNPEKALPWLANYIAARGKSAGVDWQNPQHVASLMTNVGDGTPEYGRAMAQAAIPQGHGAPQPQLGNNPNNDVMAKIQPQLKQAEDLRNLALAASNSPNPKIRAQASLLSSQAEHVQSQALAMLKFSEGQQLLSPDVEAQKVRIANAGRPTTDQRVEVNSGNKQADLILGNHNDVLQRIQQNQAIEGGFQAAETAMKGFEPGAGAAMRGDWEKAKAYLGLPNNADSAAVMNKVQADLKLAASGIMKGQGSITESERMLLQQSVDLLGNSPEGAKLVMQMIRSVHQRDQQLAQIYEKELDDSGGKPRLAEVSRAIRGLGPVVPSDVVGQLRARVEAAKGNAPQQPQGAPQGVAPRDGATATGPNGQKIILRNGQWVPMQ